MIRAILDEAPARARPIVDRMWSAIAFDAERGQEALGDADLDRQIFRIGDAYVEALWWCLGQPGPLPEELRWLSRAATAAHPLRDCEEDLSLGYCNLPRAFLAARGWAPSSLGPKELAAWRAARSAEIHPWFDRGAAALAQVPGRRARWLLGVLGRRYRRLLVPPQPQQGQSRRSA